MGDGVNEKHKNFVAIKNELPGFPDITFKSASIFNLIIFEALGMVIATDEGQLLYEMLLLLMATCLYIISLLFHDYK